METRNRTRKTEARKEETEKDGKEGEECGRSTFYLMHF